MTAAGVVTAATVSAVSIRATASIAAVIGTIGLSVLVARRGSAATASTQDANRYRTLVEHGPIVVYEWEFGDPGRWRYVSPQIVDLIGFHPDELMDDHDLWFRVVHEDDQQQVRADEAKSQELGIGERIEYRVRHRDGHVVWIRDEAIAVTDQGTPSFFRGILSDVTQRKEAELALSAMNRELEGRVSERTAQLEALNEELTRAKDVAVEASRAQSEFLSRASHELRTPLNAILGFGQLLRAAPLGPFEQDAVRHILDGGQRLLELVNDVLDISAVRSGRLALSIEPVMLYEAIGDALDAVLPEAEQRGLALELEGGEERAFVLADRQRLQQAIAGILRHAVRFARDGGRVSVAWTVGAKDTAIRIVDTGQGIRPDHLDRLFGSLGGSAHGPAERADQLGLPLAKGLLETMGGAISVETRPDAGTTLTIVLRSAEDPGARLDAIGLDAGLDDGVTRTILYIEDNPANVELVQQILAHRPRTTLLRAMLGEVGLKLAHDHRPDLVLLDLHLPDMSGEDALEQLRQTEHTRTVPVLVLSSEQRAHPTERIRSLGISGYLRKPFDVPEFLAMIDRALASGAS